MPGAEAVNAILALSILLVAGFAGAVLARLVRLPSVTGYVVGGMLIGPAGFDLFPPHLLESQLSVFTGIALMLVAFGIGVLLFMRAELATGTVRFGMVLLVAASRAFPADGRTEDSNIVLDDLWEDTPTTRGLPHIWRKAGNAAGFRGRVPKSRVTREGRSARGGGRRTYARGGRGKNCLWKGGGLFIMGPMASKDICR